MPRSETTSRRLGIVGAGKLGTTIARAESPPGTTRHSGSGAAEHIALTVDVLAPGARAVSTDEVVQHADLIVLATPTRRGSQWHPGSSGPVSRGGARDLHPLQATSELDVESPVPKGAAAHLLGLPHRYCAATFRL